MHFLSKFGAVLQNTFWVITLQLLNRVNFKPCMTNDHEDVGQGHPWFNQVWSPVRWIFYANLVQFRSPQLARFCKILWVIALQLPNPVNFKPCTAKWPWKCTSRSAIIQSGLKLCKMHILSQFGPVSRYKHQIAKIISSKWPNDLENVGQGHP